METINQLRERRAARAKDARKILDENTGDKWNKTHEESIDKLYAEIEALDGQIDRQQRLLNLEAENKAVINGPKEGDLDPNAPRAVLRAWMRGGMERLTQQQRDIIRNTMSTTTGSEGGFTVQTEVSRQIADALKGYRGVRQVAEVFSSAMGNDLQFATSDGTSEVGELISQNTTATAADPTFSSVTIVVYKYSSKIITVPIELLQDSQIDMEAFLRQRIVDRLGRITNQHFTTGTGTGQPRGAVTAAASGKVGTTGQTATVIYDDLVDLQESVDYAYQESAQCAWMMSQSSRKVVRKLKDTAGRPIWTPSYDAGATQGAPEELLGNPLRLNNDMPAMAANAKSILYGDFGRYKVRDVMDVTLFRFADSKYIEKGQIGFLAWMRSGGNYVDVGGGLKFYQNSAT